MNVKLLRRIQKQILKEPRQFDMMQYFTSHNSIPNCGTAACIAGWAVALRRRMTPKTAKEWDAMQLQPTIETAGKMLDLEHGQAARLFYVNNWPPNFLRRYPGNDDEGKAQAAVERIDHFIKTEGLE